MNDFDIEDILYMEANGLGTPHYDPLHEPNENFTFTGSDQPKNISLDTYY